ncbi:MAG: HEAT repeat domain-containing protein [Planctomycetota bacterium]
MRRGDDPNKDVVIQQGLELIAKRLPAWNVSHGAIDQYYWMWGARVAHELDRWGGKMATKLVRWRLEAAAALLSAQEEEDSPLANAGSWPPDGAWGKYGGRVYSTALAISTLRLSAYRGAKRADDVDRARIAEMGDGDADVDARLAAIESVSPDASTAIVDALAGLLRDPLPLVRLAAAEALARIGPGAAAKATRVAMLVGSEKQIEVRHALLVALLRMHKSTKSVTAALTAAAADPDPGVRTLAALASEGLGADEPTARVRSLEQLRSAAEIVAALEDRGQLGLEGVPAQIAAVKWRLLREAGLPHHLGARVGQRLALLPTSPLEQPSVLDAVEKALAAVPLVGVARPDARALTDAAIAAIEALPGSPGARARLAAAIELVLARSEGGPAEAIGAEVVARLQRHVGVLRDVAPTLEELDRDACRAVETLCTAAIGELAPEDADTEGADRLAAAIKGQDAMARELRAYPELVRWIHLARTRLLERLARTTPDAAVMALARELALDLMTGPVDTVDGQRVALQATAQAARVAPFVGVLRVASPLGRELPAAPAQEAVDSDGVRVELMDVAFQQLPLLGPGDAKALSASEQLVVRVRTTPTKAAVEWPPQVWPLHVRVRRGAGTEKVHLVPYRVAPTPPTVDVEALGGGPEPSSEVRVGQSVVTVHVFGVMETELAEGVEVTIQTPNRRSQGLEPLLSCSFPIWSVVRKVPWTQLVDATKRELLQHIPDVDASPEGVDLLLLFAALEVKAGSVDAARATTVRAEAAAQALGDIERAVRAQQLWVSLESK